MAAGNTLFLKAMDCIDFRFNSIKLVDIVWQVDIYPFQQFVNFMLNSGCFCKINGVSIKANWFVMINPIPKFANLV